MDGTVCPWGLAYSDGRRGGLDLSELYASALPRLKRIAAAMGLPAPDAEDALHDSYVALLKNRRKLDTPEDTVRWLVRVMSNRCVLYHRRKRRPPKTALRPAAASQAGTAVAELEEAVRESLRELPADELAVIVLRYFSDFNATQIGELLSVPPSTVRGRLRQVRLKLAERLVAKGLVDDVR